MSLENVIVDMTNAVRENTDATNKLILLMEGNTPQVEEKPKPKDSKKTPAKKAPVKEEAVEETEAEDKTSIGDELKEQEDIKANEDKYKHLQSCLIKLSGVYAANHEGESNAKDLGKKDAIKFMKSKVGVIRLDAVKPDQYDEFAQQLEIELGE